MLELIYALLVGVCVSVTGIVLAEGFYRLVDHFGWRGFYIDG